METSDSVQLRLDVEKCLLLQEAVKVPAKIWGKGAPPVPRKVSFILLELTIKLVCVVLQPYFNFHFYTFH